MKQGRVPGPDSRPGHQNQSIEGVNAVRIVIVGNGIAGNAAARYIRKYDRSCEIVMVSQENCPAYEPGALPYYVSGDVPRRVIFFRELSDYERDGIVVRLGIRAVGIDKEAKKAVLENGEALGYDRLILAQGGDQVIPPLKGVDKKGVFCCKVLADADALAAHRGSAAVVIGSGLIGIEAAEALKKRGYEVYLIELMDWVLPRVFDREPAELLREELERNGINVLVKERVQSIDGGAAVEGVTTDKRQIKCDTVVVAAGVVPSSKIAADSGIDVARSRGIKVDEHMATSGKDIYACGDCVESWDAITGESALYLLKHNAVEQAEVAAANCLGLQKRYAGAWNFARAHFFHTHAISIGRTLAMMGDASGVELVEKRRDGDYYRLILKEGVLVGAQAIGRYADKMGVLLGAMRRRVNMAELRSEIERVTQINSPYPWNYRVLARYLSVE